MTPQYYCVGLFLVQIASQPVDLLHQGRLGLQVGCACSVERGIPRVADNRQLMLSRNASKILFERYAIQPNILAYIWLKVELPAIH